MLQKLKPTKEHKLLTSLNLLSNTLLTNHTWDHWIKLLLVSIIMVWSLTKLFKVIWKTRPNWESQLPTKWKSKDQTRRTLIPHPKVGNHKSRKRVKRILIIQKACINQINSQEWKQLNLRRQELLKKELVLSIAIHLKYKWTMKWTETCISHRIVRCEGNLTYYY